MKKISKILAGFVAMTALALSFASCGGKTTGTPVEPVTSDTPLWADGVGPGAGYQVWSSTFDFNSDTGEFYIGSAGWWGMGVGGYNNDCSATIYGFTNTADVAYIEFDAYDDGSGNSIYIAPIADDKQKQTFNLSDSTQHFKCKADLTVKTKPVMNEGVSTGDTEATDPNILFFIGSADSCVKNSTIYIYNLKFTDTNGATVDVQPAS